MPAFGWQESGSGTCSASARRGSPTSRGPVEQFSPRTSAPQAAIIAAADNGSVPSSMRPDGSSVICAISGTLRPVSSIARRAPKICERSSRRSWAVSAMMQSTPPRSSGTVCSRKISVSSAGRTRPRSGSLEEGRNPLGPSDPATYRRRPSVRCARSASPRAIRAACSFTSATRAPSANSSSLGRLPPKVFVSTTSQPTSRYERCTPATTSGRVSERISLQPCRPSKSLTVRSPASCIRCRVVPMAPSKTTIPRAIASRRSLSAIAEDADYHAPRRDNLARLAAPQGLSGRSHAEDRRRKQEVLLLVAARLAGAQARRRSVRGDRRPSRHAGHGAAHPEVLAERSRSGAHRRRRHRLGLSGDRRVPPREVSRQASLAEGCGAARPCPFGGCGNALRLCQPAQRLLDEDPPAVSLQASPPGDAGGRRSDRCHLAGMPEAERRPLPLRQGTMHCRCILRAGGLSLPHLLDSGLGRRQGVLRHRLGLAAASRVVRGRPAGDAACEVPRGLMQFGVYIHFPYCLSKCPYCDFASRAEAVIPQQRYTDSVIRELRTRAVQFPGRKAVSIYFGGGTPSLWDPAQLGRVLREIRSLWSVESDAEVTLEANPGTTDEDRFAAFRELGVNRLSIGVQSFAPAQLVALGRKHSGHDALRAFQTARAAGFRNVSLDLIHGVERQTPALAA